MTVNTRSGVNHKSKPPSNRGRRSGQGQRRLASDNTEAASRSVSLDSHASGNQLSNTESAHTSFYRSASPVQSAGEFPGDAPWLKECILQFQEGQAVEMPHCVHPDSDQLDQSCEEIHGLARHDDKTPKRLEPLQGAHHSAESDGVKDGLPAHLPP